MKVVALVYPGMTLQDLLGPIQVWSMLPEFAVQFVWHQPGPVRTDCRMSIQATHAFADAWANPDVLMVGGGGKPTDDLLGDDAVLGFLEQRGQAARWVCSVCTGSLLLGAAGLLRGYRAATHWSARDRLAAFGAELSTDRVCIDRNRLTGGGVTAGIDFGLTVAGLWAGDAAAKVIELILEYAPEPPYGTGRPDLADPETLARAQAILRSPPLA